jgi:hypothetical protein
MKMHILGAALLASVTAAPVLAQTTGTPGTTTAGTTAAPGTTTYRDHDDFDWGWIGLLGLAGLAPLFMRRDRPVDRRP